MKPLLLLAGLLIGTAAYAQSQEQTDPIELFPQFLSGATLSYRGDLYGSNWGLDEKVQLPLRLNAEAKLFLEGYLAKNATGNVILASGAVAFLAGGIGTSGGEPSPVPGILRGTGFLTILAGAYVLRSAQDDLEKGVSLYNGPTIRPDQAVQPLPDAEAPVSAPLFESYRTKRAVSSTLLLAGGVEAAAALIAMGGALGGEHREVYYAVFNGVGAATVVTMLGSLLFHLASESDLNQAVDAQKPVE